MANELVIVGLLSYCLGVVLLLIAKGPTLSVRKRKTYK